MSDLPQKVVLSCSNQGNTTLFLWVEPWAEEYEVAPQSHLEVIMRGSLAADPEIEQAPDRITIFSPGGSLLDIKIDSVVQSAVSSQLAAPDAGSLGTRGFIDLVFGNVPEARPGGWPRGEKGSRWQRWSSKLFRR